MLQFQRSLDGNDGLEELRLLRKSYASNPKDAKMSGLRILDFRTMRKNTLLGFARVELPSGIIIADVTILTSERGAWASPPSKPMITRDGAVMKDGNGKIRYVPIIEFISKEVRDKFSSAVISAMRGAHPEVFDDERR